jgi:hypothetical protein
MEFGKIIGTVRIAKYGSASAMKLEIILKEQ